MMNGEKALTTQRPSWIQSQARRRVHGHLARLPHGGVVLREPDGATVTLGDADPFNAEIEIHDWDSYRMMMTGGALGAAEAYLAKAWDSPDLVAVIRYFAANVDAMRALEGACEGRRRGGRGSRKSLARSPDKFCNGRPVVHTPTHADG